MFIVTQMIPLEMHALEVAGIFQKERPTAFSRSSPLKVCCDETIKNIGLKLYGALGQEGTVRIN